MLILNIGTNSTNVDVNVTPDKRTLLIDFEKYLLATIKVSYWSLSVSKITQDFILFRTGIYFFLIQDDSFFIWSSKYVYLFLYFAKGKETIPNPYSTK